MKTVRNFENGIVRPLVSVAGLFVASLTLTACTTQSTVSTHAAAQHAPTHARPIIGLQYEGPIRVVYQISADEWKDGVGKGLLYLRNLHRGYLDAGVDPERINIHSVFHGAAADHLLTDEAWNRWRGESDGNPNTQLIADLARRGVEIELCDTRRVANGWSKTDVHPDVVLVAGAYQRIIDLQLQDFAYIRF